MSDFKKRWNKMNTVELVMTAVSMGCSIAMVVLGVLYLLDLSTAGLGAVMPLMGVAAIAQCALFWKKDRMVSILMALFGIFVVGVSVYMIFVK